MWRRRASETGCAWPMLACWSVYRRRVRQYCSDAALKRAIVPTIATSGSWLAVRGNCVRAACVELGCAELVVEPVATAGVCAEAVDGTGALPIVGIDGAAMERDDDAIVPSCVVPVGAAAVGAAL